MKKECLAREEQLYRSNVSLITFQNSKFLLVNLLEWPPDYWKFPQGGVSLEETLEQAVKREFQEELGSKKIRILGRSGITRKYKWEKPKRIGDKLYAGQDQTFFIVEFFGDKNDLTVKNDEIRAFCWQAIGDLERLIKRPELDFKKYWETIKPILQEHHNLFSSHGINTNEIK